MSSASPSPRPKVAVIPAAGRGRRAWPRSAERPKPLFRVAGCTLIERNLRMLRDDLGVTRVVVITGHGGDEVRREVRALDLGDVEIEFVDCGDPDDGLATGLLAAEAHVDGAFVVVLADEVYVDTEHSSLSVPDGDWLAVCGVHDPEDRRQILGNYRVDLEGDRVTGLEEKPTAHDSGSLGTGTWVFTPEIFTWIRRTAPSPRSGRVELVDAMREGLDAGRPVYGFDVGGTYVNVNSVEELHTANYAVRRRGFDDLRVSVVIPAYNEEAVIGDAVAEFVGVPRVDEVLVVDNSSRDRTAEIARAAGARVETVHRRGYGDTITWGLDNARGDILVVVEADNTFRSRDLDKFFAYLRDADMVIGTRTTRELVEQGTNMEGVVRWANVAAGKLIEVLWWGRQPRFTDIGCTYRALWRETWTGIRPSISGTGPEFAPEMMVEVLDAGMRVIEIPVTYFPRVGGESKHSAGYAGLARTASRMLRLVVARRFLRSRGGAS